MKEQLPAQVLAKLFSNSLVYTSEKLKAEQVCETPAPAQVKQPEIRAAAVEEKIDKPGKWYLGHYEKKFIVLVNDESNVYLSDKELEFLSGILNACKMNLAHIALINFKNHAASFQQLKKDLQPQFLLTFGINALQIELPFSMPDYQVQQYDGCAIITAPALAQLNAATPAAKTEKSKLWNSLKKMFNL
ncbi:hypothetical protein [Parafilimonas sp.]|uniref:hypothetical protein n=1 Tax=Parafilimonas sp. TaxID=1969739 RepID=UPI0039E3D910